MNAARSARCSSTNDWGLRSPLKAAKRALNTSGSSPGRATGSLAVIPCFMALSLTLALPASVVGPFDFFAFLLLASIRFDTISTVATLLTSTVMVAAPLRGFGRE